jgi:hypothetical protein
MDKNRIEDFFENKKEKVVESLFCPVCLHEVLPDVEEIRKRHVHCVICGKCSKEIII